MTFLRHSAFLFSARWLPVVIVIIGLSGQLVAPQPCGGEVKGGLKAHCHGKVFMPAGKRYDLKPAFFLSTPFFSCTVLASGRVDLSECLIGRLMVGAAPLARLRGPPCRVVS